MPLKLSLLLLFILLPISLMTGSVSIPVAEIWHAIFFPDEVSESTRFVVYESRLPQIFTALLAGSALAVSGLIMQTLFNNPLADPSLLGVNSGASLGAALVLLIPGFSSWGNEFCDTGMILSIMAAFIGACFVIILLIFLSQHLYGNLALLVAGVMLSFCISSVISLLNFYATADGVRSFIIWGLGNFSGIPLSRIPFFAICTGLPLGLIFGKILPLNAMLLGADYATNLGFKVRRTRTLLLVYTGFLTATVTALCGPISFIGLAVPHMARLFFNTADHRQLLPATIICGMNISLIALILTHIPGEDGTLPLGSITPLLGVPVVLYILIRKPV